MRYLKWAFVFVLLSWVGQAKALVSELVADTQSGFVFESHHADVQQPPASLTKLMTLYLTFGALDNQLLTMDEKLPISQKAASQPRSNLELKAGETITVREAILALIIKSANDVAVVLAEALAEDESRFASLMTQTAETLGMHQTVFKNASGLHQEGQLTTARDMAVLTIALIKHYPQYYGLFATQSFQYKGKEYFSHNHVLQEYEGAEGLKTGYVSAVGYNIISTAKHGDDRLVSVILGGETTTKRDRQVVRLLDQGFHRVDVQKNAEETGKLQAAFNPLNRRAFIAKPPVELYLPIMKTCLSMCREKVDQLSVHPKQKPILTVSNKSKGEWAVQVGAFTKTTEAQAAAEKALSLLKQKKEIQISPANERLYRARIHGFSSRVEAKAVCQKLQQNNVDCFTVHSF